MFGYIQPYIPNLTVGDYEYYRAAYCGLCRSMGKVCGSGSRLTLSYDGVFLALLRTALENCREREAVQAVFDECRSWYSYCEIQARRVKEEYFTSSL